MDGTRIIQPSQAGAPPDPFSKTGQNWGFPTYNWEEMERDGYLWWKKRFQKMATYFQVYRIDHVLGFFRIWRMNGGDVQGLLGYFDPALPFTEDEIKGFGTWFDYNRMVNPYIREHMLYEKFGDKTPEVMSRYLELVTAGSYRFKEEFKTEFNKYLGQYFTLLSKEEIILINEDENVDMEKELTFRNDHVDVVFNDDKTISVTFADGTDASNYVTFKYYIKKMYYFLYFQGGS